MPGEAAGRSLPGSSWQWHGKQGKGCWEKLAREQLAVAWQGKERGVPAPRRATRRARDARERAAEGSDIKQELNSKECWERYIMFNNKFEIVLKTLRKHVS